jgi:hypothetical protein
LHSRGEYVVKIPVPGAAFRQKRGIGVCPHFRAGPRSPTDEPPGDGGPDEAAAFIAENLVDLARVARPHRLDMLVCLLEMAQMEADDHLRPRGKRSLS